MRDFIYGNMVDDNGAQVSAQPKLSIQIRFTFHVKPLKNEQSFDLLLASVNAVIRGFGNHDHIFLRSKPAYVF
jgi:hypothetical protein